MKSLILLVIMVTFLINQVNCQPCTELELQQCKLKEETCVELWRSARCFKECGQSIPKTTKDKLKKSNCVSFPIYGCTELEEEECFDPTDICPSINCFKKCGNKFNGEAANIYERKKTCGASALTNLGLPMMLLVAVVTIYNKQ